MELEQPRRKKRKRKTNLDLPPVDRVSFRVRRILKYVSWWELQSSALCSVPQSFILGLRYFYCMLSFAAFGFLFT